MTRRALVVGLAVTGEAVARRLLGEGWEVDVVDDRPGSPSFAGRAAAARAIGARVAATPEPEQLRALVAASDLVVPSPGVPESHPVIAAARSSRTPVRSEIDLAGERAQVPVAAVTGTNGKTTVTTLTAAMLEASGVRVAAAGNIGRTLLDAVDDPVDVLVAEVSSFQLAFAPTFRPRVAVLLAVAPDHLDWHGTFERYAAAKARVFEHQREGDLLVFDADDPVATQLAREAPARTVGVARVWRSGAFGLRDGALVDDRGAAFASVSDLTRSLPHDRTNALAAAAAARAVGATDAGVRAALATSATLPHRVALVGEHDGVRYYDDSKATNPHAALHAIASFDSVVLLAGGRNKGLDLRELTREAPRIRSVVAFGEAAPEVAAAFDGVRPVTVVATMHDAVRAAHRDARAGDAVLLSPGCASFDAYDHYGSRGDDFAAEVRTLTDEQEGAQAG